MTGNWRLPALRASTIPTPADLTARRAMGSGTPPWAPDPSVTVRSAQVGGVPCIVCEPPVVSSRSVYFHGGGYRLGSAEWFAPFATRLARQCSTTVVVVDYRLAPEHPFPAALHDAAAVYDALLARDRSGVVAVGDSAGGGLAAALTVAAARSGVVPPAGLVLMSPWLDLACTSDTYVTRAESDQLFSLESARGAAELYLQGHDPADALASPGRAALDRWPPTLVLASCDEVLLDDSVSLVSRLAAGGSSVTAVFEPGRPHAWPSVLPDQPESTTALEIIASFYRRLGG